MKVMLSPTQLILSLVVLIIWGSSNYAVFFGHLTPEQALSPATNRALGIIDASVMVVLYYCFGSSAGSRAKDSIIDEMARINADRSATPNSTQLTPKE